ncbi:hypothetical protein GLYMA_19G015401v4 [Glycine max]|nr:hypothetical protein GLYMA_19G015401v4 [Glycine max]KAG4395710.1 hypothetical protein GLYMA_19G015401v4 [Glycine max]
MPSIYCGMCFTIFIYCCTPFPFVFQSVILFFTIFTFSHFSLLKCYLPLLCSFFPFIHSPCFFTSKAVIFYTKTVIFISDSMTTISYLCSSPSLHFYIVFLVEEHIKAVILISKLFECREDGRRH